MPGVRSYQNFDLLIRRIGGRYRAEVLTSPAGAATADFTLPFSPVELENFVLRLGRPRRGTRRVDTGEMRAAKALGTGLYDAVFAGDVGTCWRNSLSEAEGQNAGLRLRLRIDDAPELDGIPWEYLHNASVNRFLSLSEHTPLIRYLELPEEPRPLPVSERLEILVMISSPTDYPDLDVEGEWARLNKALAGLIESGRVRLERLVEGRLSMLQRALRRGEYHILHFIGHGGFDPTIQDGVLAFCDESGKGRRVAAQNLGTILHDHRSLRLVVLNACEGSRSSPTDQFSGVAPTLVQQGVPAVIAMQFEISDQAAVKFAEELYLATADGYPIDAALSEARKRIWGGGNETEWGIPVLFLRAPDGQLFSINPGATKESQSSKTSQLEDEEEGAAGVRLFEKEKAPTVATQQAEDRRGSGIEPFVEKAVEPDRKRTVCYFVSFSRRDKRLKDDLLSRLEDRFGAAKRYRFDGWQDKDIELGSDWDHQIQAAIGECDFGLLLVTPAFLGSDYISTHELPHFVADEPLRPTARKRAIPVALRGGPVRRNHGSQRPRAKANLP
jgi:hypothetical protein